MVEPSFVLFNGTCTIMEALLVNYHRGLICSAEDTEPDDVVFIFRDWTGIPGMRWRSGEIYDAAHRIPPSAIPAGIKSPFVVLIRSVDIEPSWLESLARRYSNFFQYTLEQLAQAPATYDEEELMAYLTQYQKQHGVVTPWGHHKQVVHFAMSTWVKQANKVLIRRYLTIKAHPLTSPAW